MPKYVIFDDGLIMELWQCIFFLGSSHKWLSKKYIFTVFLDGIKLDIINEVREGKKTLVLCSRARVRVYTVNGAVRSFSRFCVGLKFTGESVVVNGRTTRSPAQ